MQIQHPAKLKNFPEVLLSDKDVLRAAFREMVVGTAVLDVEVRTFALSFNCLYANNETQENAQDRISQRRLLCHHGSQGTRVGRALLDLILASRRQRGSTCSD